MSKDSFLQIRINPVLKAKFKQIAELQESSASAILEDFIQDYIFKNRSLLGKDPYLEMAETIGLKGPVVFTHEPGAGDYLAILALGVVVCTSIKNFNPGPKENAHLRTLEIQTKIFSTGAGIDYILIFRDKEETLALSLLSKMVNSKTHISLDPKVLMKMKTAKEVLAYEKSMREELSPNKVQ